MALDSPAARLRWAREHHKKYATATEAARAFGWAVSTYLGHENGDRNPSRSAAKRYATAYHVRWEWLLEGDGSPQPKATVRIVGDVSETGEIKFYPKEQVLDAAELPPGGSSLTVAVKVLGGSMRGIADDRWLIYFDHEQRPPTKELIGKLCVVELEGGDVLVRFLQQGRRKGRFDLESWRDSTLRDCRVVWAARVTWIKPR